MLLINSIETDYSQSIANAEQTLLGGEVHSIMRKWSQGNLIVAPDLAKGQTRVFSGEKYVIIIDHVARRVVPFVSLQRDLSPSARAPLRFYVMNFDDDYFTHKPRNASRSIA